MARIIHKICTRMSSYALKKHLPTMPVMQIFTRMYLVTNIHTMSIELVEYWHPALCKFIEPLFHQALGPLWIGIQIGPQQRTRERHMSINPKTFRSMRSKLHLLFRPSAPFLWISSYMLWSKSIHNLIVRRMDSYQLPRNMRGEFCNLQTLISEHPLQLITIDSTLGRQSHINQSSVPCRDLYSLEPFLRRPFCKARQRIVRCLIRGELRKKNTRSFDRSHFYAPSFVAGTGASSYPP